MINNHSVSHRNLAQVEVLVGLKDHPSCIFNTDVNLTFSGSRGEYSKKFLFITSHFCRKESLRKISPMELLQCKFRMQIKLISVFLNYAGIVISNH